MVGFGGVGEVGEFVPFPLSRIRLQSLSIRIIELLNSTYRSCILTMFKTASIHFWGKLSNSKSGLKGGENLSAS